MNLSKIGKKYEVISDSDSIWRPGTVVIAVEDHSLAPQCSLDEKFWSEYPNHCRRHCMEMSELRELPIRKRKIEIEISTNRVGSEQTTVIEVDADATDEEIDKVAWEAVCDMLNFTWRDVQ